jgi:thymidylate synthase (FAD)
MSAFAAIKGKKFPVLDDGFVYLVDMMGDDSSIVQAARVSYGAGTKTVNDDRGLIRYLMRHRHSTPFEMVELKFHVRVPMDTWRQWVRHRTANINEYSTRYSEAIDSQQSTSPDKWRTQSTTNKQGSGDYLPETLGTKLSNVETEFHKASRELYDQRLAAGVAREQARKDLPLSTYTEAYWKIDLHNLLHFLALRMDSHAQEEIRCYASTIGYSIVSQVLPFVWEAFEDYRLQAVTLTKTELKAFQKWVQGLAPEFDLRDAFESIENKRERDEARTKVSKLLGSEP